MNQVLRPDDNVREKMAALKQGNIETENLKKYRENSYRYLQEMVENSK